MPLCPPLKTAISPDVVLQWSPSYHNLPIVIDNGSYECRAGYVSANRPHTNPHMIFKNVVYKPRFKKDPILVGNDIVNMESLQGQLKTPFERNLVTQMETQEFVFDHIFHHLGYSKQKSINSPVVINEPLANPLTNRAEMSELLFEAYNVPGVVYYVDSLASWHNSISSHFPSTPQIPEECVRGLVLSLGYQTVHLVPLVPSNGLSQWRPLLGRTRRINVGSAHVDFLMQRLLQLKYPSHCGYFTLSLAEHLVRNCCHLATPYREVSALWRDPSYEATHAWAYNLPYPKRADALAENGAMKQLRVERLKESQKERTQNQLNSEKEELQRLEALQLLFLQGYNSVIRYKSSAELKSALKQGLAACHLRDRAALDEAVIQKRELVQRLEKKLAARGQEERTEHSSPPGKGDVKMTPGKSNADVNTSKRDAHAAQNTAQGTKRDSKQLVPTRLEVMAPLPDNDDDVVDEDDEAAIKRRRIEALKLGAARRREATKAYQSRLREKRMLAVKELESKRGYDYLAWIIDMRNQRRQLHESVQRQQRNTTVPLTSAAIMASSTLPVNKKSGSGTDGAQTSGTMTTSASTASLHSEATGSSGTLSERRARQSLKMKEMTAQLLGSSSMSSGEGGTGKRGRPPNNPSVTVGDLTDPEEKEMAELTSSGGDPLQDVEEEEDDAAELLTQLDLLLAQYDPAHSKETYASVSEELLDEYFKLHVASEQIKCPEVLFHPSLIGSEQASLAELLDYLLLPGAPSTNASPFLEHPIWRDQSASSGTPVLHVLVTGGMANLPGVRERVAWEVKQRLGSHVQVNVNLPENASLDAWLGARQWTLGEVERHGKLTASPFCISRANFEECGHDYLLEHHLSNLYISSHRN